MFDTALTVHATLLLTSITSVGKDLIVQCPTGQHATGGGGFVFSSQAPTFFWMNVPVNSGGAIAQQGEVATGWRVAATFD